MGAKSSQEATSASNTRRALLVGCNYPSTKTALKGCVSDVECWHRVLTRIFGFEDAKVTRLVDDGDASLNRPTGKNIKRELRRMVRASRPGDVVFFHFSGYGAQIRADTNANEEVDGLDETIVPSDLDLITDDELRDIVSKLPSGVKFTMVADCGRSGGLLDHRRIAIQGKTTDKEVSENSAQEDDAEIKILRGAADKRDRCISRTTCSVMRQESIDALDAVMDNEGDVEFTSDIDDPAILVSACQSNESAYEVTDKEGRSFGVFTHSLIHIISSYSAQELQSLTYRSLIMKARQLLKLSAFDQSPGLECTPNMADRHVFID